MDWTDDPSPSFPADAFAGTADYYVLYRVPYPRTLLAELVRRAGIPPEGSLLDLASGPGRLALALAPSFGRVWAIDLEAEMVEAGRREALRQGVTNVEWTVGKAETLKAPDAMFDLVTIGEAFHRLDQRSVACQTLGWLKPGRCIAILGCHSVLGGREPWQHIVAETILRWTGRETRNPDPAGPEGSDRFISRCEEVLRETGFIEVGSHSRVEKHVWTIEAIQGYLYSTSICTRKILGANTGAFEDELRSALLAHDPGGTYRENLRWGYTLGRKYR